MPADELGKRRSIPVPEAKHQRFVRRIVGSPRRDACHAPAQTYSHVNTQAPISRVFRRSTWNKVLWVRAIRARMTHCVAL